VSAARAGAMLEEGQQRARSRPIPVCAQLPTHSGSAMSDMAPPHTPAHEAAACEDNAREASCSVEAAYLFDAAERGSGWTASVVAGGRVARAAAGAEWTPHGRQRGARHSEPATLTRGRRCCRAACWRERVMWR
jgi:hypothetical protein